MEEAGIREGGGWGLGCLSKMKDIMMGFSSGHTGPAQRVQIRAFTGFPARPDWAEDLSGTV